MLTVIISISINVFTDHNYSSSGKQTTNVWLAFLPQKTIILNHSNKLSRNERTREHSQEEYSNHDGHDENQNMLFRQYIVDNCS